MRNLTRYDWRTFIASVLSQCRSRSMELPFVLRAVSSNGSRYVVRYFQAGPGDKLNSEVVENHMVASGLEFPVNIRIADETGEAVGIKIEQMRPTFHKALQSKRCG
jgi:hypothetical protein